MTTITKERLLTIRQWRETYGPGSNVVLPAEEAEELARIALASLESEPVAWADNDELTLDYLQGQKDGLEWAAQLAEANHPYTGDWLYDDPLELAKAIRKGPDMPGFAGPPPVTPGSWVMVPKQVTPEISNAINVVGQRCTCGNCSQRLWDLLLDATQQGVNRG
ncbi:TPA: hypothetical protein IGQ95_003073 [Escherichia coli]|nr:hypothetical protein [Escherichia coli]